MQGHQGSSSQPQCPPKKSLLLSPGWLRSQTFWLHLRGLLICSGLCPGPKQQCSGNREFPHHHHQHGPFRGEEHLCLRGYCHLIRRPEIPGPRKSWVRHSVGERVSDGDLQGPWMGSSTHGWRGIGFVLDKHLSHGKNDDPGLSAVPILEQ